MVETRSGFGSCSECGSKKFGLMLMLMLMLYHVIVPLPYKGLFADSLCIALTSIRKNDVQTCFSKQLHTHLAQYSYVDRGPALRSAGLQKDLRELSPKCHLSKRSCLCESRLCSVPITPIAVCVVPTSWSLPMRGAEPVSLKLLSSITTMLCAIV